MRRRVSDRDEICDQINHSLDDLITSVDAMRWRPESAGDDTDDSPSADESAWVPSECKARFDALYETIDAFAGAIDDRMQAWETRVQSSFPGTPSPADTAERDALTMSSSDQR